MVSGKSGVNMSPSPPRGDAPVYKYHINYIHRFVVINVIIIINKNDNIIKLFLGRRHTISVLTSFFRFFASWVVELSLCRLPETPYGRRRATSSKRRRQTGVP